MKFSKKTVISLIFLIGMVSSVAGVPQLEVSPTNYTGVNGTLDANRNHQLPFEFYNNGSEEIVNVTTPDSSFLDFERDKFDLDPNERKTVDATIFTRTPTQVRENVTFEYKYNDTSGNESQIRFDRNSYPKVLFDFSTEWVNTEISFRTYESEFNLSLDETESTVFKLDNDGQETAYNIDVQGSDYVEILGTKKLNLTNTTDEIIEIRYGIPKPDDEEEATALTNQTYRPTVTISGDNFESTQFRANVFVPFKEYDNIRTQEDLLDDLNNILEFCQDNPQAPLCGGKLNVTDGNETQDNITVNKYNLTEDESQALQLLLEEEIGQSKNYTVLRNRIELLSNRVESQNSQTRNNLTRNLNDVISALEDVAEQNQKLAEAQERENQQEKSEQSFGIWVGVLVIGGGSFIAGFYVLIRYLMKRLEDKTIDSGL